MRPRFLLFLTASFCLLLACSESTPPSVPGPVFVGSESCQDCHATQYTDWQNSHHDLAMQVADTTSVLGDFNDATFEYFGTTTQFRTENDAFVVRTANAAGQMQDFAIAYTFGVTPLQQYLVEMPGGRLQALPFAWDARDAAQGGQRWFHLYGDEYIGPDDALHWTGRQQNWNVMCAECHSTNLDVNFDVASDSFSTTWSEINVGCEACHGPGSTHVTQAESGAMKGAGGLALSLDDHGRAVWQMNLQTGIAERSELLMRFPQQPEACGRCHARRGIITADYEYGEPLAQTHRTSLLDAPLYYADGQIRGEVYVYGSFVQSRMYREGVTCSDCHNPHSLELVTGEASSDVCGQCHLAARFASSDHHRHASGEVDCVDCHMPATIYMGVDARRDHSFRVPRPHLSLSTDSPNACNGCHTEQSNLWAAARVSEWWGDAASLESHFATALYDARAGFANSDLVSVISDANVSGIARATALTLLARPLAQDDVNAIVVAMSASDSLVRMGAVQAARAMAPESQLQFAAPLLSDPVRSVRIEAAALLAPLKDYLPGPLLPAYLAAANEFRLAQGAIASRPEAHAALGGFEASSGNFEQAMIHYAQSLQMQPNLTTTRINYADAMRHYGDESRAEALLREGVAIDAANAVLRHSLGLLLVRTERTVEGLRELREAARLDSDNSRYIYVVGIALNSLDKQEEAIAVLDAAAIRFTGDFDITWALATMFRDRGEIEKARAVADQLAALHPGNSNVAALLESLSAN
ncbi:MAG: ammonia-forming cytochrome c nitrite reductase subunit c552 [Proteobacteria bacterium]|nr:ammonia-forming cytochrome c nitrite reductase subunit c552 [Pseudomonadota bacterium]